MATLSATQLSAPPRRLSFKESVNEEVKSGGVYLVGVMEATALSRPNPEAMHVWIPDSESEKLCVRFRSLDGVYSADAEFDISGTGQGPYELEFPSEERQLISRYVEGELVLDGRIGRDCTQPETLIHVPMSWATVESSKPLMFFVNADGNDAFIQAPVSGDLSRIVTIECELVPSGRARRAYTSYCLAPRPATLDWSEAWLELRHFGRVRETEGIDLRIRLNP